MSKLVLVIASTDPYDRIMLRLGEHLRPLAEEKSERIYFLQAYGGPARQSTHSLQSGFSPTARFEPHQSRHVPFLEDATDDNFAVLVAEASEAAANDQDAVVVAVTDAAYVRSFIPFYFRAVAKENRPSLNDFLQGPGSAIVLDTDSHEVRPIVA